MRAEKQMRVKKFEKRESRNRSSLDLLLQNEQRERSRERRGEPQTDRGWGGDHEIDYSMKTRERGTEREKGKSVGIR